MHGRISAIDTGEGELGWDKQTNARTHADADDEREINHRPSFLVFKNSFYFPILPLTHQAGRHSLVRMFEKEREKRRELRSLSHTQCSLLWLASYLISYTHTHTHKLC